MDMDLDILYIHSQNQYLSSYSNSKSKASIETSSYENGLGIMKLPYLLNGYRDYVGYEYVKKCENSYALKEWFATPFTIIFPVEISDMSIESGSNITCFGESI